MANNIKIYNRIIYILIIIFSVAFCVSCGTTRISCTDPNAEIYQNNEFLDKGEATISSIGPPHTALFTAKKNGQIIGAVSVSRKFTLKTLGLGLVSCYTGFYWGLYYPDEIIIPLYINTDSINSSWDNTSESIWLKPIQKKK